MKKESDISLIDNSELGVLITISVILLPVL